MLCALFAALGVFGWLGMGLTTPAAIAPIVIATIAVARGYTSSSAPTARKTARRTRAPGPEPRREPHAGGAQHGDDCVFRLPLAQLSAVPPFRDLGNLVALGVLAAGALTLTLLPALLLRLPDWGARRACPSAARGIR